MKYWRVIRDKSRSRQTDLDKPLTAFPVGLRSVDSNLAAETVVSSTGRTAWISFSKWNLINISKEFHQTLRWYIYVDDKIAQRLVKLVIWCPL